MRETNRLGEEIQAGAERFGREYQNAAESGFEAVSRSFSEANKGLQVLASEMSDFSKRRFQDVFRAWEQLMGAKSVEQVFKIQSQYAATAYETYISEMSKFGEMYLNIARKASKPVEQTTTKRGT